MITKLIDKLKEQTNYRYRQRTFKKIKKEKPEIYKAIKQYFEDKNKLEPELQKAVEDLITVLGLEYK